MCVLHFHLVASLTCWPRRLANYFCLSWHPSYTLTTTQYAAVLSLQRLGSPCTKQDYCHVCAACTRGLEVYVTTVFDL